MSERGPASGAVEAAAVGVSTLIKATASATTTSIPLTIDDASMPPFTSSYKTKQALRRREETRTVRYVRF